MTESAAISPVNVKIPTGGQRRTIIKLAMPWDTNLYRYALNSQGWPHPVEVFVKNPKIRAVVGRWLGCPNGNVAKRIHTIETARRREEFNRSATPPDLVLE